MKYDLIAFDMDGTLLNDEKKINKSSLDAIEKALDAGKHVVLSTGRGLPELQDYLPLLPKLRYLICLSGAFVYDLQEKKVIYSNPLDGESIEKLLSIAKNLDCMPHLIGSESIVQAKDVENMEHFHMKVYQPMYQRITRQVEDIFTFFKEKPSSYGKNNYYHASSESKAQMLKAAGGMDVECVEAESFSLEFSAKGVSKGKGLEELCKYLEIDIASTIAVGDADNDLNILSKAGLAIAMGNGNSNVKAIADVIVGDNNHDGCKEAIENYLLGFVRVV